MSTPVTYTGPVRAQPGSPRAKAVTAGAVIALATAIAGAALVAGIATGSSLEAPGRPGIHLDRPGDSTSPLTSAASHE